MNPKFMIIGLVALCLAVGGTLVSILYKPVWGLLMIAMAWLLSRVMSKYKTQKKK